MWKKLKKLQKKNSKKEEYVNEEFCEKVDDEEKEVDPDYPKAPEWWSGPTDPRVKWPSFPANDDEINVIKTNKERTDQEINKEKKWPKIGKNGQILIDFPD